MGFKAKLRILLLLALPLLVCLIFAPVENYPLSLLSFAVLALAVLLLWRPEEPPLMMLIVVYQWLQASTKLIHADLTGVPLDDMLVDGSFGAAHPALGALGEASLLSVLGLLALIVGLALGHRWGTVRSKPRPQSQLLPDINGEPGSVPQRLILATALAMAGSMLIKNLQYVLPGGLTQIILPLVNLKWAFVFALACAVLRARRGYGWLVLICAMEILLGFAAYFSAWKEVILVLVVAYFFCRPSFALKHVALGTAIVAGGLLLAVFWTAIKSDQRMFLNQGSGQQVIVTGTGESLRNAFELAATTEPEEYRMAALRLAERIAYVDYFANVLIHVPQVRQHEHGRLWWQAVTHVFTPRILFPDKPPLPSDSEQTMYYTGLRLASGYQGTSISLGYMAESYVDFGVPGMFLPIFLWGLLVGYALNAMVGRFGGSDLVWGAGVVIILGTLILEVAAVKMVGGTLMSIIVMFLLFRFLGADIVSWINSRARAAA